MRNALAMTFGLVICIGTTEASAQSARTWVSGQGSDTNACTMSAPCQTFAGAIAKTDAGGEIDALDAGSYGPVTITKAITIDGGGVATITGPGTGAAIEVNAAYLDNVIIRNLTIQLGQIGIRFTSGRQVVIENTKISDVSAAGVLVPSMPSSAALGNVVISNSTISGTGADGFTILLSVGVGVTTVSHSVLASGRNGMHTFGTGVINADSNILTHNGIAVDPVGGTIRLSNNDVYNNLTGFSCGTGVLASTGNNRKASNSGGSAPACSPTAAISVQ